MSELTFPENRASASDILAYLTVDATPLSILKIINHAPGKSWKFSFTADENAIPVLAIYPPSEASPTALMDGTCPELYWCEALEVISQGLTAQFDDPLMCNSVTYNRSGEEIEAIVLRGYQTTRELHPDFMDRIKIKEYLSSNTWMGSSRFYSSDAEVQISVLANRLCIKPRELAPRYRPQRNFTRDIVVDNSRIVIKYPITSRSPVVRIDTLGILNETEALAPLIEVIQTQGLDRFEIELQGNWPYEVGPLGNMLQTERVESKVEIFSKKIQTDSQLGEFVNQLRKDEIKRQANALNARLAEAKTSPLVYWKDHVIGCEPKSELGTVSIIHKLEGMGALPLSRYDSLAWAGHEGIDAIVDLQFAPDQPVMYFSPVEYEFLFENFIKHGHPVQHVRLIVCWDDKDDPRLMAGVNPWMPKYASDSYDVPVLVIKKLPHISVRKRSK